MPVMIDGEYKIGQAAGKQEPIADLTVTCRLPATAVRVFHANRTNISDVPRWLASLPADLIEAPDKTDKPLATFNADEQFKRLVERAEAFSKLGEWYFVQGLRQAALMLKPMDGENRMKLFNNQRLLLRSVAVAQPTPNWLPAAADARLGKLVSIYRDGLANVEFLIRNQLINKRQAVLLTAWPEHSYRALGLSYLPESASARELIKDVEQERKDFLWRIAPLAFELPDDPADKDDPHRRGALNDLQLAFVAQAIQRVDLEKPTAEDLDFLFRFWTTRIPDQLGFVWILPSIRYRLFPDADQLVKSQIQPGRPQMSAASVSTDEWAAFLERIAACDHQTARALGKVERLVWRWYLVDRNTPREQFQQLITEVEDTEKELKAYPIKYSNGRMTSIGGAETFSLFDKVRWQIERMKYSPDPFAPRRKLQASQPKPEPTSVPPGAERPYTSGRVTLKKLPFTIPVDAFAPAGSPSTFATLRYQGPRWTVWGSDIDLVWNSREIWWMKQAGKFAPLEISAPANKIIEDAQPHGKLLWVAVRKAGIWVIDQSGKTVCRITEADGLPPSEHALRVYPLEQRKACAVGSFGREYRDMVCHD